MATIYNSDLTKELILGGRLQVSRDIIPSQLAEKVVPVMEVNPKLLRVCYVVGGRNDSTTGLKTVYTTPSDRDFYLTSIHLSLIANAACDIATGGVNVTATVGGASKMIIGIPIITLTAQSGNQAITFDTPIKIDRNVAITVSGTFTAGVLVRTCTITGYFVDNSNA